MKRVFFSLALAGLLFFSCKKSTINTPEPAAFNVVNATTGSAPLIIKPSNMSFYFSTVNSPNELNYGKYFLLSPVAGNVTYSFVQSTDTLHTLFQGALNLQSGQIYSFFLAGAVAQPDTLFVHDVLPFHADSTAGIRFVNLSKGSSPVSVDIKGQANGSEVSSLSYKGVTSFKSYVANHTVTSYIFEFRDVATGNLLATYTLAGVNNATGTNTATNTVRFHNMTIALIGQPAGGTVAQSTLLIPNY